MISLLPIGKIITVIAIIHAAFTAVILWLVSSPTENLLGNILVAFKGATALNALLFLIVYFGWRKLWLKCPSLNRRVFPDLNGTWEMTIHWQRRGESGEKPATAFITQDFLSVSMEVETDQSDSETLLAKAMRNHESGRPLLYYIFRNTSKKIHGNAAPSYEGAAILKLDHADVNKLEGNYFTSAESKGAYTLTRKVD